MFDFGHTQKCAKSDASLSVDAFDGVRDGDRIRASGDVLFFHILSSKIYDVSVFYHLVTQAFSS